MNKYEQTDGAGVRLYQIEYNTKPHGGVCVPAPEVPDGKVAVWQTDIHVNNTKLYGEPNTGQWALLDDLRKDQFYIADSGEEYTIGSDFEGDSYNGIGEIPTWLTVVKPPEPTSTPEQLAAQARFERDKRLNATNWLVERHREQQETGATTLMAQEYADLLAYRQALRDVPQQDGFPETIDWPILPE